MPMKPTSQVAEFFEAPHLRKLWSCRSVKAMRFRADGCLHATYELALTLIRWRTSIGVDRMLLRTLAFSLCLVAGASALPQMAAAQQQPNCLDFRHNADGSWSPTHTFTASGTTLDPSWHFYPGQVYGSTNVVGMLNQYCVSPYSR